jgi:tRNA nucleotidyltransferase (CCA-adding enzyme)
MNAIAMDRFGHIVDPFDGRRAIKEKIIQTVGQANDRFQEDSLRMMRAVRFVSQLSFSIEGNTILALTRLIHLLERIAVERKRAEFEKLLTGKNCKNALRIMLETNLYSYLPGLSDEKEQIERLLSFEVENLTKNEMWSLLLFCLDLEEKSIGSFLREWRLPGKEIKEIQHIFHFLAKRLEKEWDSFDLYLAHEETIKSVEALFYVINGIHDKGAIDKWISIYNQLPIKHRSEMKVTGSDLMEWFDQKGGPWLSERLSFIEHAIIAGHITNDKLYIKEWLKGCSQK